MRPSLALAEEAVRQGDVDRAEQLLNRILARSPGSAEAWYYLGTILLRRTRYEEAATAIRRSLALAGDFFEGLHILAILAVKTGRPAEAIPIFEKAEAIRPDTFELLNDKGIALNACRRFDAALETYDRAARLNPSHPSPWLNRGVALNDMGQHGEAISSYRKALDLKPDYVEAWCNMGNSAYQLNRFDEALAHYRKALAIDGNDADSLYGQAGALLVQGRFEEGLKLLEYRWKRSDAEPERHRDIPKWLGDAPISGKRLLIWSEQGHGDTLQYCRYVPLVAALGADVTLEVPRPLQDLVATIGGCSLVTQGKVFDYQVPMVSLPLALKTTVATIPSATPYLSADSGKMKYWKERLGDSSRRKVGIACSGSAANKNDVFRSMPLENLTPLQGAADLFLLQKDLSESDRHTLTKCPGIRFMGGEIQDFQDTAAIVCNLDLVVSVDTSLAHVAGALAKPVWILLPHATEWRWLSGRSDTPWYPSAKLFRQAAPGDWRSVMEKVVRALNA
jgi:tetratricopeptide (TPR) repeat protein